MKINDALKFIVAVLASESAGLIGSIFTVSAIPSWYAYLNKPSLNPPAWLFGPVWTLLYVLMGGAAYLIWREGLTRKRVRMALGIFVLQLILNALWSIVFFGLHNPGLAFADIIALWLAITWTMISFAKISRKSVWLLWPYLIWVTFAAYLNLGIWLLN